MDKPKIAVIGAGLMGCGITQVCSEAGFIILNIEISNQAMEKSKQKIQNSLDRQIAQQLLTEIEKQQILNQISYSNDINTLKDADIIIEAIPENLELKKDLFKKIDKVIKQEAIIATNTSGLSISAVASFMNRPQYVIGLHFFSPVTKMKLVEIIRGIQTCDETYQKIHSFITLLNKTPIDCFEYPGFIVNRLLIPMINEAAFLVMEGAKPADIDLAMKLGANHPMGPLSLCDFIGIDTVLAIMNGLYDGFKDTKYRPCPILINMVNAGHLGRKANIGFYQYH